MTDNSQRQAAPGVMASEVRTYLWLEELASQTGIPINTLRSWRSTGSGGPKSFVIGRRVAYDIGDVQSWLKAEREATGR